MSKIIFIIDKFCDVEYYVNNIKVKSKYKIPVPNGKTLEDIIKRNNLNIIDENDLSKYEKYCVLKIEDEKILLENFDFFYTNLFTTEGISEFKLSKDVIENYDSKKDRKFFYLLDDAVDMDNFDKIKIPENVLNEVKKKNCFILMNASMEPTDIKPENFRKGLELISKNNGLNKYEFFILTGNLITKNNPLASYTMIPHLYFLDFPAFFQKYGHVEIKYDLLDYLIEKNKKIQFDKKVLCYQRNARRHRRAVFYYVKNNPILDENFLISLWDAFENILVNDFTYDGFTEEEDAIIKYYFMANSGDVSFDGSVMSNNLGPIIDIAQHKKTFLSLVSETSVEDDVIFISEKTLKPIYCLQPFIILGNKGIVKKLKEFGFKTFDKWWDESYDDEPIVKNRIIKILKIVEDLCKKSDDELRNILIEMEEILVHNFNLLTEESFLNYKKTINNIPEYYNSYNLNPLKKII